MRRRTLGFILISLSSLLLSLGARAQPHKPQESLTQKIDTTAFFAGRQVFVNVAGVVLWQAMGYGEAEGGVRLNLGNKYFPVVEAGLGLCDKTNDETDIHYKTSSPFFRIGLDYNFIKDKASANRIYGGVRFGYSSFKYNMDAPTMSDPNWAGSQLDFNFKDQKSNATWAEAVFGLETHVWRRLSLGWTARYKRRLNHKLSETGKAWYIPGYGENDGHLFTGTFNVVLDI